MWNIEQPDRRVSFTTIPMRLFSYLLEHTDKTVSREELLNNIWRIYGLEPSNNSVNQYISLIRKSLIELGCEQEIIKTIPRLGFYIAGDMVSFENELPQNCKLSTKEKKSEVNISKWFGMYKVSLLSTCLLISLLLILQPIISSIKFLDYHFPKTALFKIGDIGNCPVYSFTYTYQDVAEFKLKLAKEIVKNELPCINNNIYIFHPSVHYVYQKTGRAFITRCSDSDQKLTRFSFCKGMYFYGK
ncbi:winged helix-turn-helix domain-containing protein (plasmid) [Klebsiella pasteurii]|uniref:winged helix-turn-helix domain-containing protein n=1 Tax=Klebsiella pasteurii TaxID=2587529 RepID=UPI002543CE7F|nr:winged helix-turn-helix domain-containing protein [Klebsiella pasteurii]WII85149.1 winged helix-turn-helix domain-containing protein [Klebsiella pasteurii]